MTELELSQFISGLMPLIFIVAVAGGFGGIFLYNMVNDLISWLGGDSNDR